MLLALLFAYGVLNGILQGFGIMPYLGLTTPTLEYYTEALTRSDLISSILFSLYVAAASSVLATMGGVTLSAVITRLRVGRTGRLASVQIPIMTAHTVVALSVISLFSGSGLLARVLNSIGVIGSQADFPTVVGSSQGWAIILVYLWKEIPFVAFSTFAIMGSISDRFSEAASSLGASPLRTFFAVTVPLSSPAIAKSFLIVFAFAFGSYEVPLLLGSTLPRALPVLAYIEYSSPELLDRAHAMALNGIMSFITLILAWLYLRIIQRERRGR
ncbi:MAG: ABC transporter permease subunit [Coriobacteriia bacterium]|nr:ABC transporter permease subunit [Coriobacteriia bacterium]